MSNFGIKTDQLERDARFTNEPAPEPKLWTPSQINTSAELGASVMFELFGADKAQVTDKLTSDYETVVDGHTGPVDIETDAIVGLTLGEEGGEWISPSQLVAGYNRIASSKDKPDVYVWEDMYINRPASWWNQRTPIVDGKATNSKLSTDPINGLISVGGLHGLSRNWKDQQAELSALITSTAGETTPTEAMTPQDWLLKDTAALIAGTQRPDTTTFTRFVQHQMDRTDSGIAYGPGAYVSVSRAYLGGSRSDPVGDGGFRVVVGQKVA